MVATRAAPHRRVPGVAARAISNKDVALLMAGERGVGRLGDKCKSRLPE